MNKHIASLLILFLAVGSFYLALEDQKYRSLFADFAQVGLGGFLALLAPGKTRSIFN
jgi:hypothetical protein